MKKDFLLRLQTHPQQPAERKRPVSMAFRLEDRGDNYTHPRQSHLQKERPVCISIEGHGDHNIKGVMQWCRVNYGVVLLLGVVGCRIVDVDHERKSYKRKEKGQQNSIERIAGYQTATPPPYYTTIYATTSYYTEVAQFGLQLNHQGSRLLHHNLCCSSSYTTKALEYYTEAPKYYTTKAHLRLRNYERPSTIEISRVSFSDTQHGSPEVSNKLRFKHWNGKQ
ncbi:hypothetical protein DAPPUDRAFT_254022 [Daphnia pulex]|uniref:Uncharacterized protein n=1 Tax=Daphnia pulex TaxID=6669 RepID=E9H651_DAPPU|nr:hypothetical protein DAPPUDRAFT_254022 [Daphnia pulex]|eukprot:EFX72746.1 hypothetical protein DAPPUDRAFT_254022 [Daphnia pulex]